MPAEVGVFATTVPEAAEMSFDGDGEVLTGVVDVVVLLEPPQKALQNFSAAGRT
jgi:hypothetical protein